jgi:hypothetical protein
MLRRLPADTLGSLTRKGAEKASARRRGKTWMGLYRDAEGRQRSAGSFATKKEALKAATVAEAGGFVTKVEAVMPSKIRGRSRLRRTPATGCRTIPCHRMPGTSTSR